MLDIRHGRIIHSRIGQISTIDECFSMMRDTVADHSPEFPRLSELTTQFIDKGKITDVNEFIDCVIHFMKTSQHPLALNNAASYLLLLRFYDSKRVSDEVNKIDLIRLIASRHLPGTHLDMQSLYPEGYTLVCEDYHHIYSIYTSRMVFFLALGMDLTKVSNLKIFANELIKLGCSTTGDMGGAKCMGDSSTSHVFNAFIRSINTFVFHIIISYNVKLGVDMVINRPKELLCRSKSGGSRGGGGKSGKGRKMDHTNCGQCTPCSQYAVISNLVDNAHSLEQYFPKN